MPTPKNLGALRFKESRGKKVVELLVPTGTKPLAIKDQAAIWKVALKRVGCLNCLSGMDFIIKEGLETVLPAALDLNKDLADKAIRVDIRSGAVVR